MAIQQKAKALWMMMLSDTSFTKILTKIRIISAEKGKCVAEMTVSQEHSNLHGTLHGGMTATIVDNISTLALVTYERPAVGVSTDLHVTYLKAANIGEDIIISASALKCGKNLAFLDVLITKKKGGDIIAKGSHTKFVGAETVLQKINT